MGRRLHASEKRKLLNWTVLYRKPCTGSNNPKKKKSSYVLYVCLGEPGVCVCWEILANITPVGTVSNV